MTLELVLYLISVLSFFSITLGFICIVSFGTALVTTIFLFADGNCLSNEDSKYVKKVIKISATILVLSAITCGIIPSERTMYLMAGAHYLKQSDIPKKVEMVLTKKLDEFLVEEKK